MTIRLEPAIPDDNRLMVNIWFSGCCLRCFCKPWSWPYGFNFNRWGMRSFGAGPLGFMFWGRKS